MRWEIPRFESTPGSGMVIWEEALELRSTAMALVEGLIGMLVLVFLNKAALFFC